jgi:lysophospholipase
VDFLLVNDNSADTDGYFPNGTEILHTYQQARAAGLTRMPVVPSIAEFMAKGMNKRASFFGCHNEKTITIAFLPNTNYTSFNSGQPSSKLDYTNAEANSMIENGVQIATQNGDPEWPACLACAMVMKTGEKLPARCKACFEKYCYVEK